LLGICWRAIKGQGRPRKARKGKGLLKIKKTRRAKMEKKKDYGHRKMIVWKNLD